jgi:hypothetical protein
MLLYIKGIVYFTIKQRSFIYMHKNKTVTTKVFNQMFEMIEMLMGHYENCMFHILVTKI